MNTDAEKAFDRVSWRFLEEVLRQVGVGEQMVRWIMSMYTGPRASVRVNGVISPPFKITNGTRQGCPLSPPLFALTLEPLLIRIRQNVDIQGIQMGDQIHKVAAYADDLLFSVTNPHVSLPNLVREIEKYGRISNLKINTKSEAMKVAIPGPMGDTIKQNFRFKWGKVLNI